MNRICWWLVAKLSRGLTPDERDAVRGDFAELRLTGGQALREMLGLVARREAEAWRGRRAWIVLAGAVIPLAMLLGVVSNRIADTGSVYGWLYVNNWSPAILDTPGARRDFFQFVQKFALQCAALIGASWIGGIVARLARAARHRDQRRAVPGRPADRPRVRALDGARRRASSPALSLKAACRLNEAGLPRRCGT